MTTRAGCPDGCAICAKMFDENGRDETDRELDAAKWKLDRAKRTLRRAAEVIEAGADGAIVDTVWACDGMTLWELIHVTLEELSK